MRLVRDCIDLSVAMTGGAGRGWVASAGNAALSDCSPLAAPALRSIVGWSGWVFPGPRHSLLQRSLSSPVAGIGLRVPSNYIRKMMILNNYMSERDKTLQAP
jgi:hypothetical protein